jgi:hypothetical protein
MPEMITEIELDSGVEVTPFPAQMVDDTGTIVAWGSYDGKVFKSLDAKPFPAPRPGYFWIYTDPGRN